MTIQTGKDGLLRNYSQITSYSGQRSQTLSPKYALKTNPAWRNISLQAIFDATNTTRERRATVYERIVHQHGLKCMFLESICNRWVKSVLQPKYVFRTIKQMSSLFSRKKKMNEMMVFWLTSSQKCGQSGEWKLPKWTSLDFHEIAHRALFKTVGNNSVL